MVLVVSSRRRATRLFDRTAATLRMTTIGYLFALSTKEELQYPWHLYRINQEESASKEVRNNERLASGLGLGAHHPESEECYTSSLNLRHAVSLRKQAS